MAGVHKLNHFSNFKLVLCCILNTFFFFFFKVATHPAQNTHTQCRIQHLFPPTQVSSVDSDPGSYLRNVIHRSWCSYHTCVALKLALNTTRGTGLRHGPLPATGLRGEECQVWRRFVRCSGSSSEPKATNSKSNGSPI